MRRSVAAQEMRGVCVCVCEDLMLVPAFTNVQEWRLRTHPHTLMHTFMSAE
jgi:hypothetical protein